MKAMWRAWLQHVQASPDGKQREQAPHSTRFTPLAFACALLSGGPLAVSCCAINLEYHEHSQRFDSAVPFRGLICSCIGRGFWWRRTKSSAERGRTPRSPGMCWSIWPVSHRDDSRVRPRARVPAGGRGGGSDRALASWRSGLCEPAATAGSDAVEHRRGPARQRCADPDFVASGMS